MTGASSLETLAQVAIALAGFGSLVVVLRRDPAGYWAAGESLDLLIVVGGSLLVLFFSLLPLPIFYLGLAKSSMWRLSSALLALALAVAYAALMQRRNRLLRAGSTPSFPSFARVLVQLPVALVALLSLDAAGLLRAAAGIYLLVLLLLLAASSFPLVSLVLRLGADEPRDEGGPPDAT